MPKDETSEYFKIHGSLIYVMLFLSILRKLVGAIHHIKQNTTFLEPSPIKFLVISVDISTIAPIANEKGIILHFIMIETFPYHFIYLLLHTYLITFVAFNKMYQIGSIQTN